MFMSGSFAQINAGQDHKNISLDQGNSNMKPFKDNRDTDGHQGEKNECYHLPGKHVREETNGERQQSRGVAENFDGQHQRRQPPYRSQEMLEVSKPVCSQSLEMVVEPGQQRATKRDNRDRSGRVETRDNADQIAGKDKESQCDEVRMVRVVVMTNYFFTHVADEALDALHRMLQAAGLVDRQTRANRDEECDQYQHHNYFHGETVGDWRCRVMGMDSENKQQRCDRAAEEAVEQRGEPELLHNGNPNLTIQTYDSGRSRLVLRLKISIRGARRRKLQNPLPPAWLRPVCIIQTESPERLEKNL
jgi:hypothetical protein